MERIIRIGNYISLFYTHVITYPRRLWQQKELHPHDLGSFDRGYNKTVCAHRHYHVSLFCRVILMHWECTMLIEYIGYLCGPLWCAARKGPYLGPTSVAKVYFWRDFWLDYRSQGATFGWGSVANGIFSANFVIMTKFHHFFFRSKWHDMGQIRPISYKISSKWLIWWHLLLSRVWFCPIFRRQGYDFGSRSQWPRVWLRKPGLLLSYQCICLSRI